MKNELSRRDFLKAGVALVAAVVLPEVVVQAVQAAPEAPKGKEVILPKQKVAYDSYDCGAGVNVNELTVYMKSGALPPVDTVANLQPILVVYKTKEGKLNIKGFGVNGIDADPEIGQGTVMRVLTRVAPDYGGDTKVAAGQNLLTPKRVEFEAVQLPAETSGTKSTIEAKVSSAPDPVVPEMGIVVLGTKNNTEGVVISPNLKVQVPLTGNRDNMTNVVVLQPKSVVYRATENYATFWDGAVGPFGNAWTINLLEKQFKDLATNTTYCPQISLTK